MAHQTPDQGDFIARAIRTAIETETKKIVDEEAVKAGERAAQRVRGLTAEIATHVFTRVNFERFGQNDVRIIVDIPNQKAIPSA